MNKFSEQLLQAFEVAMDEKLSQLQYDKTIQATIEKVENLDTGEYKIKYQDGIMTAYAKDPTETFKEKDVVYVTVPQGDFNNKKFISHRLTNNSLSAGQYSQLSETIIEVSPEFSNLGFTYTNMNSHDSSGEAAYGLVVGDDTDISKNELNLISFTTQLSNDISLSASLQSDGIYFSWTAVEDATRYELRKRVYDEEAKAWPTSWTMINNNVQDTCFWLDRNDIDHGKCQYRVRYYKNKAWTWSTAVTISWDQIKALDAFFAYLKAYKYIQIKAEFKTEFVKDPGHIKGDYGVCLIFKNSKNQDIPYFFNLNTFNGNPYRFFSWSPQSMVLQLPEDDIVSLAAIKFYEKDFEKDSATTSPNLFMKDFSLTFVEKIDMTDVPYYLNVMPDKGVAFTEDINKITLNSVIIHQGEIIEPESCIYKWFVRDLTVLPGTEEYDKRVGWGWRGITIPREALKLVGKCSFAVVNNANKAQVDLSWNQIQSARYEITRKEKSGTTWTRIHSSTTIADLFFADIIDREKTYQYRIRFYKNNTWSDYFPILEITTEDGVEVRTSFTYEQNNSLIVNSSEVIRQQMYKILAVYDSTVVMTKEITLVNLQNSDLDLSIQQEQQNNRLMLKLSKTGFTGYWYYLNASGSLTAIVDSLASQVDVTDFLLYSPMTFYCQVYKNNIYQGELTFIYTDVQVQQSVSVIFTGESIFLWDANGDSNLDNMEIERSITANVTFDGTLTEQNCTYAWYDYNDQQIGSAGYKLPTNTMFESVRVDTDGKILYYILKQKFQDEPQSNNTFKFVVTSNLDGKTFEFEKEIVCLKTGDPGTNGTRYSSVIKIASDSANKFVGTSNSNKAVKLTCTVYRDSTAITPEKIEWTYFNLVRADSSAADSSTIQVKANNSHLDRYVKATITIADDGYEDSEGHETVLYNFYSVDSCASNPNIDLRDLPNYIKYAANGRNPQYRHKVPTLIYKTEESDISVEGIQLAKTKFSINGEGTPETKPTNWHDEYQNTDYYAIQSYNEGTTWNTPIKIKDNSGAITELNIINNYKVIPLQTLADGYFKPLSQFDYDMSIGLLKITIDPADASHSDIIIYHPVPMYINTYGNEAINGWDGTSIDLGKDNLHVFAPSVGAGKKNDVNQFSGVVMGIDEQQTDDRGRQLTGLYGYAEGENTFGLMENGQAFFGKSDSGRITIDGTIAEIKGGVYGGDSTTGMTLDLYGSDPSTSAIKIGAGKFEVDYGGNLHAENAEIEGKITADSGTIGGWTIEDKRLSSNGVSLIGNNHIFFSVNDSNGYYLRGNAVYYKTNNTTSPADDSGDHIGFKVKFQNFDSNTGLIQFQHATGTDTSSYYAFEDAFAHNIYKFQTGTNATSYYSTSYCNGTASTATSAYLIELVSSGQHQYTKVATDYYDSSEFTSTSKKAGTTAANQEIVIRKTYTVNNSKRMAFSFLNDEDHEYYASYVESRITTQKYSAFQFLTTAKGTTRYLLNTNRITLVTTYNDYYRIVAGRSSTGDPADSVFSVSSTGNIVAKNAVISGTIETGTIEVGKLGGATGWDITANTIKSWDVPTTGTLLKDKVYYTGYDSTNNKFTGTANQNASDIGIVSLSIPGSYVRFKFDGDNNWYYTARNSVIYPYTVLYNNSGSSYALWAGNQINSYAPFSVTHAGKLHATNAEITGNITANSGTIGGWTATNKTLYNSSVYLAGTNIWWYETDRNNRIFYARRLTYYYTDAAMSAGKTAVGNAGKRIYLDNYDAANNCYCFTLSTATGSTKYYIKADNIISNISTFQDANVQFYSDDACTTAISGKKSTAGQVVCDVKNGTYGDNKAPYVQFRTVIDSDANNTLYYAKRPNNVSPITTQATAFYRIWSGNTNPASANFSVTSGGLLKATNANISGTITASTGEIGGWKINTSSITTAAPANTSYNRIAKGVVYASKKADVLSSTTKTSAITEVVISAITSETISGEKINVAQFTMDGKTYYAKFTTSNFYYYGGYVALYSSATTTFIAGGTSTYVAPFYVTKAGVLHATGATISGSITATSGKIGNWSINNNSNSRLESYITQDSQNTRIYLDGSATGTNHVLHISAVTPASGDNESVSSTYGQMYVDANGHLYATSAEIKGKITSAAGSIAGWNITRNAISSLSSESTAVTGNTTGISKTGTFKGYYGSWNADSSKRNNISNIAFWAGMPYQNKGTSDKPDWYLYGNNTGSFFAVTTSGNLYCRNANISGYINANQGGTIGSWTIAGGTETHPGALRNSDSTVFLSPTYIKLGNLTINSGVVTVSGTLTAETGSSIGGWKAGTGSYEVITNKYYGTTKEVTYNCLTASNEDNGTSMELRDDGSINGVFQIKFGTEATKDIGTTYLYFGPPVQNKLYDNGFKIEYTAMGDHPDTYLYAEGKNIVGINHGSSTFSTGGCWDFNYYGLAVPYGEGDPDSSTAGYQQKGAIYFKIIS